MIKLRRRKGEKRVQPKFTPLMGVLNVYERNKFIEVRPRWGPNVIPKDNNIELDNGIQVQVSDLIPKILSVLECQ